MKNLANLHWLFVLIDFIGQAIYLLPYFDNILQKKDHQKTVDFQGYSLTFLAKHKLLKTHEKPRQSSLALCFNGFYWSSHLFTSIF